MNIVCLDMEGVLVPEIWIAFAEASGIPELRRTTRDEPDYDKLMRYRIAILKEHGLKLQQIQETIAKIDPMPGAKEFLDALRSETQVMILSDTFEQFAMPLMKKLGYPTLLCNTLEVAPDGEILGHKMRCEKSKLTTVRALQSIGYETIASGDSFNDLGMIQASKAGFLFRTTEQIKKDYPQYPAYETFDDLLAAIAPRCWDNIKKGSVPHLAILLLRFFGNFCGAAAAFFSLRVCALPQRSRSIRAASLMKQRFCRIREPLAQHLAEPVGHKPVTNSSVFCKRLMLA